VTGTGPLSSSTFRWLVAARTTSLLGNAVAPVAQAFAVLDLTGSVTDLGLVVASRSVANVALLLLGGVIADRLPRHLVLTGSSLAAAVTQGTIATLVLTGAATVSLLAALSVLNGAVAALTYPASSALTPQTLPAEALQAGNAVLRIGANSSAVLGAALGGIVVAGVGPGWGLVIDASSFLLAAGMFRAVRLTGAAPPRRAGPGVLVELREGWGEFRSRQWVWIVVCQFAVVNAAFTGAITVLGPVVADATVGRAAWGLVLAAETLGLLAGGVLALRWAPRRALGLGVLASTVIAIPVLVLAVVAGHGAAGLLAVLVLVVANLLSGMAIEQFSIAWDVSLQQHVPPDWLARVYSYDALGSIVAVPVGEVAVGPLAGAIGVVPALLGCAAAIVIATAGALSARSVRTLERVV